MCTDGDYDHQASPDSDTEKKGRERDGKREKDLEKDKENDNKSRGKSRSDSKQKSPKRKAAKEEVGFLYYCINIFLFLKTDVLMGVVKVTCMLTSVEI